MTRTEEVIVTGAVERADEAESSRTMRVDAHDAARLLPRPIASAFTDERGQFEIRFRRTTFSAVYGEKLPELSFRVYRDGLLLRDTGDEVVWSAEQPRQQVKIVVEYPAEFEAQPVDKDARPGVVSLGVIRGRLVDSAGKPAANHRVIASRGSGEKAQRLGGDVTDAEGSFALAVDRSVFGKSKRWTVSFAVQNPNGRPVRLARAARRVEIDADQPLVIDLPADAHPRPPALPIETLTRLAGIELTAELRNALEQSGIATLSDVRAKPAFRQLLAKATPTDRQNLALLESHANLTALNPDLTVNAALITAGYRSIGDIASAPADEFIAATAPHTEATELARLHAVAGATSALLDGLAADAKLERAAGSRIPTLPGLLDGLFPDQPDTCACQDCEAAVSPLAYLADLIAYAIEQIRVNNQRITLDTLEQWTRQPLGALPAECSTVENPVRQVRIAVEVLRRHLASLPLPAEQQEAIGKSVETYCEAAYQALLWGGGCTLVDLLTIPANDERARERLAMRLAISVNHLDGLTLAAAQRTEAKLEALFGLAGTQPDRDPLKPAPQSSLEKWRLEYVESVWFDQDHPADPWPASEPRIDPDLIGPDDFREPRKKAQSSTPDKAFDLWVRRREWVDVQYRVLTDQRPKRLVRGSNVDDLTAMLNGMKAELDYGGTPLAPWPENAIQINDFPGWARRLRTGNGEADVETLRQKIQKDVHLDDQAFLMLVDLWEKDQRWIAHERNAKLTDDDWLTVASILTQARKAAFRAVWLDEETAAQVSFDPHTFWSSLTEPKAGSWPPPASGMPWIDPERVGWADLPDMEAGGTAQALWTARRTQISQIRDELSTALRDDGFQAVLNLGLGNPPTHNLDLLREELSGLDETKASEARETIAKAWQMSVDDFDRLMVVRRKVFGPQPGDGVPTDSEWADVLRILTTAKKVRDFYPSAPEALGVWRSEEVASTPRYWQVLKAMLPAWRASPQRRALWQQSLRQRYRPALIDPDVIVAGDFRRPSGPAYQLWSARKRNLQTLQEQLTNDHPTAAGPVTGLDAMCNRVLMRGSQFLVDLHKVLSEGHDIGPRLAQLNLTPAEFDTLLQIRRLADAGQAVPDEHWAKAKAALVLVSKRRDASRWRDNELKDKVFLSPSDFEPLTPAPNEFFLPAPGSRRTLQARREWQDVIEARAEQRRSVVEGLRTMVGAVEAAQLPTLRDALIELSDAQGDSLSEKARWLAARLFIDLELAGCDLTTRAAQATTSLQTLISSIRTGLTRASQPTWRLDDPHFDKRWEWLKSYATWRAAMFVQLYPENILVPSLRRERSEGFRALVSSTRRTHGRFSPEAAIGLGDDYAEHYRDIHKLAVETSCHCLPASDSMPTLAYWFARVPGTSRCYWSTGDPSNSARCPDRFWNRIDAFSEHKIERLIAAVPFRDPDDRRFILLLAISSSTDERTMLLARFDVAKGDFEGNVHELASPDDVESYEVAVVAPRTVERMQRPDVVMVVHDLATNQLLLSKISPGGTGLHTSGWQGLASVGWVQLQDGTRFKDGYRLRAAAPARRGSVDSLHLLFEKAGATAGEAPLLFYKTYSPNELFVASYAVGRGFLVGVVPWTNRDDVFVVWKPYPSGVETYQTRLLPLEASQGFSLSPKTLLEFDGWLKRATGRSLGQFRIGLLPRFLAAPIQESSYEYRWPQGWFKPEDQLKIDSVPKTLLGILTVDSASPVRSNNDVRWRFGAEQAIEQFASFMDVGREASILFWQQYTDADDEDRRDWLAVDRFVRLHARDAANESIGLADCLRGLFALPTKKIHLRPIQSPTASSVPELANLRTLPADYGYPRLSAVVPLAVAHASDGLRILPMQIRPDNTAMEVAGPGQRLAPHDVYVVWAHEETRYRDLLSSKTVREDTERLLNAHRPDSWVVRAYMREFYYFVPVHLGLEVERGGHFENALDWYRTVYDDRLSGDPVSTRKVWYGLVEEESLPTNFRDIEDWLLDPLNPHAVAARRANTYTRYTLLSIIRCLLAYADHEFTLDTPRSVSLARQLYQRALVLLDLPELRIEVNGCDKLISEIEVRLSDDEYRNAVGTLVSGLRGVNDLSRLRDAVVAVKGTLADTSLDEDARLVKVAETLDDALAGRPSPKSMSELVSQRSANRLAAHNRLLADKGVAGLMRGLDAAASREMVGISTETPGAGGAMAMSSTAMPAPTFPSPVGAAATVLTPNPPPSVVPGAITDTTMAAGADGQKQPAARPGLTGYREFVPGVVHQFCVPPNPIIGALRLRAEMNLFKANNCRNIAGVERQLEPYEAATDTTTGLPSIGPEGNLIVPGLRAMAPTPHRFPVLIERARQLAQTAFQMEGAMLSALQQLDNERYSRLKARQDLRLSRAGVQLQELRLIEAEGNVALTELQQERAQFGLEHYEQLLSEGLLGYESAALWLMAAATVYHFHASAAVLVGIPSGSSFASSFSSSAAAFSQMSSAAATFAQYERRRQEWEFQRGLGQFDVRISAQAVRNSKNSLRTVGQERNIAGIQADHAQVTLDFLDNKFGTVELYDWMSGVLEDVYSYFLFQATTVAKQASAQLAFARQQPPPSYIQDDYWSAPSSGFGGAEPDRRGLTGSARLLQDITQLEQFALDNEKRNQNLEKTFSLARMAPAELQRFRETGVIVFATPIELFDRDFPGHYLRLIKRVRLSIPALIPPVEGIRATLTSSRLSRVVIGGDIFQTVRVQQGPEQVAYTSARNASGVFELDPQPTLLLPFEGIGVDTQWQLQLPKAANHFDFGTIADVLITIEYTALNDFNYREQVIRDLSSRMSAERAFSFRRDFPDQWYDLHHPEATDRPMIVRFDTRRADFPANLDALRMDSVTLLVARSSGASFELPVSHLRFSKSGGAGEIGGEADTIDGIISTRRGNAGSWRSMLEGPPVGGWELSLPNTPVVRGRFASGEIEDLLLVIGFSGRTPQWPA